MRMSTRLSAALLSLLLPACGGSSNTPAAPPPVTTPPTTMPNFSGTYVGLMDYNVQGQGVLRVVGRTTLTHSGSTISYTTLVITFTTGQTTSFVLGNATLSGGTATGTTSYQSTGCGLVNVETVTRFGPPTINLTVELRAQTCAPSRLVGELNR